MITEISIRMEACLNRLHNLKIWLNSLVNSTEKEFLAIGKDLQDFHDRAEKMSGIAADTVGLVSGDDISSAVDGLQNMLGKMDSYLTRSSEEFSQIDHMLRYNVGILEYIINTLRSFEKIVKNLRILSINTKILSADLGPAGEGFRNLAEDVKKLSQTMDGSAGLILKQSGVLTENIRHAVSGIERIQERQSKLSRIALRNAESTLLSLREKQGRSLIAATRISALSGDISQNTGSILVSLQFHDISRQQIEHVMDAVNDLCPVMESGLRGDIPADKADFINSARHISNLQAAQLDHSGKELMTSVEGIIQNLSVILRGVKEMAEHAVKMAGSSGESGSSFLSEMENEINDVTSFLSESLAECTEIGKELSSIMGTIDGTLGDINLFVESVEEIGAEIELLALNARIKSAHTGEEGLGLSVIAEAIQSMSEDVCKRTSDVSETLKGMVNAINDLKSGIDAVSGYRSAEVQEMIRELGMVRSSLHAVNGSMSALIMTLNPLAEELAEDIRRAIDGISVHKSAAGEFERCVSAFNEINESISGISRPEGNYNKDMYREIESRYTMRSERDIHMQHVDSGARVSNEAWFHISDDKAGSVELFH